MADTQGETGGSAPWWGSLQSRPKHSIPCRFCDLGIAAAHARLWPWYCVVYLWTPCRAVAVVRGAHKRLRCSGSLDRGGSGSTTTRFLSEPSAQISRWMGGATGSRYCQEPQ